MAQPPLLREGGEYACPNDFPNLDSSAVAKEGNTRFRNRPRQNDTLCTIEIRAGHDPPASQHLPQRNLDTVFAKKGIPFSLTTSFGGYGDFLIWDFRVHLHKREEVNYALDAFCDPLGAMAARNGVVVYDGRVYPYPADPRACSRSGSNNQRPTPPVTAIENINVNAVRSMRIGMISGGNPDSSAADIIRFSADIAESSSSRLML